MNLRTCRFWGQRADALRSQALPLPQIASAPQIPQMPMPQLRSGPKGRQALSWRSAGGHAGSSLRCSEVERTVRVEEIDVVQGPYVYGGVSLFLGNQPLI